MVKGKGKSEKGEKGDKGEKGEKGGSKGKSSSYGKGYWQDAPQKGLGKGMKGDSKGSRESAHKGSKSGFQDVEDEILDLLSKGPKGA
mmetsp:Transcript_14086/g.20841  ORF Transcript_14086/g.20841 Transcript_14086/m.20841 type:complete len:87 (+) Transcript_14086:130-390(+)